MKYVLLLILLGFAACHSKQQTGNLPASQPLPGIIPSTPAHISYTDFSCNQTQLSNQFDVVVTFRSYKDIALDHDSSLLRMLIKDKKTKILLDTISITLHQIYDEMYTSCDSMTSFTTGFHATREAMDNWVGDIVIADLNFDNRDDIAAVRDAGGNGGPFYNYYIQSPDKKFVFDSFLTDSVSYFPSTIDKPQKYLITLVQAGACCVGRHVYHLDIKTGTWSETSHKILGDKITEN